MRHHDNRVGVTLVFLSQTGKTIEAVLKSYVLNSKIEQDIFDEAYRIGKNQNSRGVMSGTTLKYLGIHDLFVVYGPIRHGVLLCRNTEWGKSIDYAKGRTVDPNAMSYLKQLPDYRGGYFLATPVYFVDHKRDSDAMLVVAEVLVEATDYSSVFELSKSVAVSDGFLRRLAHSDLEGNAPNSFKFLGFEDIQVIYEDPTKGGAFMHVSSEYDSIEELQSLIITPEEIQGFFEWFPVM
jgi:hypothetical protein